MRLIKQIVAFLLLSLGIPLGLYCVVEIFDSTKSQEDRDGAAAALMIFSLPMSALGGGLLWSAVHDGRKQQQQITMATSENLRKIFFQILEENKNTITVLQFCKAAEIDGKEAKEYLDQKAIEFNATFEASESGGIIYKFP
ncbi:slr0238 [Synechocystis sp. PCC 6803]|jgi:hypothetical protein|uniref:Slr0238 protein n=1 Tax=Synechocystis sp. (strain ATCC 27184 / PCC 6803 / Kazusa) TaxID=1111708 RepID=P72692_SYNY3|nr:MULTISPECIES: hypothetical protein [unclassified Synechocystis]BAM50402.1 hypothetical protein BEST7613_1471 [Synechocystis sp. PCC 6803] [Bacillus subtilis BEST7613]AGF50388.1 hypothetical protein MYO_11210 [Synechocystis sp. PCC 6803]ALJ66477.1 hypothetical protein AOY38_00620 [Synechocystis sp. PCC 6803]AVP88323.1 hypothetical protein C7I86_00630 [Synechocystis sp. IPPAS B-1465]MBD2616985.1 hypothetical protein [Synechocystis sp. FACHB-898]